MEKTISTPTSILFILTTLSTSHSTSILHSVGSLSVAMVPRSFNVHVNLDKQSLASVLLQESGEATKLVIAASRVVFLSSKVVFSSGPLTHGPKLVMCSVYPSSVDSPYC